MKFNTNIVESLKKWWFTTENLFSFEIGISLLNFNFEMLTPLFKFEFETCFPEFLSWISLKPIFSKTLKFNEHKSWDIVLEFWSDLSTGITVSKSIIPKHIHTDHFFFEINILGLSFHFSIYDNRFSNDDNAKLDIVKMITEMKKRWRDGKGWWNYRVLEEVKDNVSTFRIIEVYYDDRGKIYGCSDDTFDILVCDTYNDLKYTCEVLKDAFGIPVLKIGEDDYLYEEKDK